MASSRPTEVLEVGKKAKVLDGTDTPPKTVTTVATVAAVAAGPGGSSSTSGN